MRLSDIKDEAERRKTAGLLYYDEYERAINTGLPESEVLEQLVTMHLNDAISGAAPQSLEKVQPKKREFLWYPYIPKSEYTVIFAESGIGKSFACLAIAAARSKGEKLPGETIAAPPSNTLYITSEDDAEDLKERISGTGADFSRIFYLDRESSLGIDFSDENIDTMQKYITACNAELVIVDPWQAFIGENIDTNRQNQMRAVLQKISVLAKQTGCAIMLVSHVNKRERRESINNAPTGSGELINACRSALTIMHENSFTEETRNKRLLIQTKSSHAAPGRTVRYDLTGGRVKWDGFSDVDRWTVDYAAQNKLNLQDAAAKQRRSRSDFSDLKRAIMQLAARIPQGQDTIKVLYTDIEEATEKGKKVWNAPANADKIDKSGAIAAIKTELYNDYDIAIACISNKNIRSDISKKSGKGISITRMEDD